VVAAWELALRLRRRRAQAGVDVKTITDTLNFTRNYWSAVENERKLLSAENLIKLFALLDFDEEEQRELLELREVAKERGWWTRYSGLFDSEVERMYGMEAGAQSIRGYESLLIPGLLQTAEYARAIMTPSVVVRRVEVDQRVEARLQRQQRLTGDDPMHITAIISEAALCQQIGGPAILRGQLTYLAEMIEAHPDTIDVRILPFTVTACGLFGAATVQLMDFENRWLPTMVWHETVTAAGMIDDPDRVRDITTTYHESFNRALDAQESLKVIRRRTKELI
jgi:transcriptional regulator with XRE-family HTH domain